MTGQPVLSLPLAYRCRLDLRAMGDAGIYIVLRSEDDQTESALTSCQVDELRDWLNTLPKKEAS